MKTEKDRCSFSLKSDPLCYYPFALNRVVKIYLTFTTCTSLLFFDHILIQFFFTDTESREGKSNVIVIIRIGEGRNY